MNDKLLATGWSKPPTESPRRAIVNIMSWEKSGKTHLSLTAPEPIIYLDIDVGTEGVIQKFKDKDIYWRQFNVPDKNNPANVNKGVFEPVFDEIREKYREALAVGEGTVVVDTFSEVYEIKRLAAFGKLGQVMPQEYGIHIYPDLRDMVREAYATKMNVIFAHRLEAVFEDKSKDQIKGFKEMPYAVQCSLRLWSTGTPPTFRAKIENCRHNPQITGTILSSTTPDGDPNTIPMSLDFKTLLGMIHR